MGISKLVAWRDEFVKGELMQRPKSWQWTRDPCKWCDYKGVCKEDDRNGVKEIAKSSAISFAKKVNAKYDYVKARKAVIDRWSRTEKGDQA